MFEQIDINMIYNLLIIGGFILLIVLRIPVAFSMLLISFSYIVISNKLPLIYVSQTMVSGVAKYTILAVPLFMTVGELMNSSGISNRLFDFADKLVGHINGGLGHVNILASLFFAGVSGSAAADAAGLGNIEIKAMTERGYDVDFAVSITAASSVIGPIFPPSGPMILFGTLASISVGSLFIGGVTIGIIITIFLMITVYIISKNRNYPLSQRSSIGVVLKSFGRSFFALLLPVLMLVTLTTGIVSTTEVGAFSVMYSLILGVFVYKELKMDMLKQIFQRIVETTGMIMLLIAGGTVLAGVMGAQQLPREIGNALLSITENPHLIMLLIVIFILFIGTFLETNAALLLSIPLLTPIMQQLGVNGIQYGIILILGLMIGLLTPPMAICLFITSKIGGISVGRAFRATSKFYFPLIFILLLVAFIPELTLFLPRLIYGSV